MRAVQSIFQRLFSPGGDATPPNTNPSSSNPKPSSSRFGQTSDILIARQVSPGVTSGTAGGGTSRPAVFAVPTVSQEEDPYESPAEVLFKRIGKLLHGAAVAVLGQGGVQQLKKALNPPVVAVIAGEGLGCRFRVQVWDLVSGHK